MRLPVAAVVLALVAATCGGETTPTPSPRPSATSPSSSASPTASPSPSPSPSPTATPTPKPVLHLPPDAPTMYPKADAPADVPPEALVPPKAQVTWMWIMSPPDDPLAQIGVAWARGEDPFVQEHGFVVWQPSVDGAPWRAVFGFTDPPAKAVLGLRLAVADMTGDGMDDALSFEETGGSGGCGTWRVVATAVGGAAQILKRKTCDAQMQPVAGDLVVRESVFGPDDPHCCPGAFRETTLRWNGESWDVVDRKVTEVET